MTSKEALDKFIFKARNEKMKEAIKISYERIYMNCPTCGCEFSYKVEDAGAIDKIICPCCGSEKRKEKHDK